ncbi:MAG: alanine/glycine:cation symporter family protein [Tissierellia bacterium]|nr:alanine/glycine:cation symporter family protein [Tissierellia bacterium]
MKFLFDIINGINGILYDPVLIILLLAIGLYFTLGTGFIQIRYFREALRVVMERPSSEKEVSSFQALMVSTASRVGTGNIVGVSSALCLGGYGAIFWMWLVAIIGGASAFVESTLAQIYKRRDGDGGSYGGPAYYIESALKSRKLGVVFAVSLVLTYAVGFNMLAAYNLTSSFTSYEFYRPEVTPWIIGGILALVTAYCLFGGGKRILAFTSTLVPIMGIIFVLVSVLMIIRNIGYMPTVFRLIFQDAFNFQAIFGGMAGSSLMYGIKRGLYSNEAGIGSAPNAAAAASVSHPAKQGLVQMLSVAIDTLLICSATAFMCLSSGIAPDPALDGAPYVQEALSTFLGPWGHPFVTLSLSLFAFTTLIGNLYYVENNLTYIRGKKLTKGATAVYQILAVVVIFLGAAQEAAYAWAVADLLMGVMALINLPAILALQKHALAALRHYSAQRKEGRDPQFSSRDIGLAQGSLDYWG